MIMLMDEKILLSKFDHLIQHHFSSLLNLRSIAVVDSVHFAIIFSKQFLYQPNLQVVVRVYFPLFLLFLQLRRTGAPLEHLVH